MCTSICANKRTRIFIILSICCRIVCTLHYTCENIFYPRLGGEMRSNNDGVFKSRRCCGRCGNGSVLNILTGTLCALPNTARNASLPPTTQQNFIYDLGLTLFNDLAFSATHPTLWMYRCAGYVRWLTMGEIYFFRRHATAGVPS